MDMVRSFLPVGQGAFYCECFHIFNKKINIIYDCGSGTNVKYVEDQIRNNFEFGENIDALFLSHLDQDHINGVPFLLKYCHVNRIFFPLIDSSNKKIMKVDFAMRNIKGFTSEFLDNPQRTIDDLQLEYTPVLVSILEDEDQSQEQNMIASGFDLFNNSIATESGFDNFEWLYIPFNFRQTERIKKLKRELLYLFSKEITEDELEKLWKRGGRSTREKIKKAYKKVPGGLNTNTMTLFSGTKNKKLRQYIKYNAKRVFCDCGYYCNFGYNSKQAGCLFTGDYDASGKQKWEQLKDAYSTYWGNIGCVQVPHHGSKHNFNNEILNLDSYFIISAGYDNPFGHPHAAVIKQFMFNNIMPFVITQQAGSAFYSIIQ